MNMTACLGIQVAKGYSEQRDLGIDDTLRKYEMVRQEGFGHLESTAVPFSRTLQPLKL